MDQTETYCGFSPSWEGAQYRVLLAFDSFKGSLTARQACDAAASAIISAFGNEVIVSSFPMADGGEGSLDLIMQAGNMQRIEVPTIDAIGRSITTVYAMGADGVEAHIEIAGACGLPQVSDVPLRPLDASTYGVGKIVDHALTNGARKVVLYLGGSASTDAGTGLLSALGARFLNSAGELLPFGGGALIDLASVDLSRLNPVASDTVWTIVTDVDAPLVGPFGASRVFASQKGANEEEIEQLEAALCHVAEVAGQLTGTDVGFRPGAGAAGGLAALLAEIFEVTFVRGSIFFAEHSGLTASLPLSDLVITGEGRFDSQSFSGKVVGTVADLASSAPDSPRVVVVAGSIDRSSLPPESGVLAAFSVADGPADLSMLSSTAAILVGARCVDIVSLCRS